MKDQLQQIIETMRRHVLKNLESIKANESHIKEVLAWPQSIERTKELNESYKFSKTLLAENNDFINLQVSIMNFLNKYKSLVEAEAPIKVNTPLSSIHVNTLTRDDYFRLTVENDIAYDESHPYFNDNDFYTDLFYFYEKSENYEMCAELIRLKKEA